MGVQGFTPFLQKTAPHIIHKLPNRLRDLAGKKLVLDGTLITQRLHFAPSPHPFRHVLGWYNLAKEFNDNNISAVCIFDGNTRTKAKAIELGRREASRKLHVSRGTLESVRIKRLQKLQAVMATVRALDEKGKSAIAEMLSRLNASDGAGTVGTVEGLNRVGETLRVLSGAATPPVEESLVQPEPEPKQKRKRVVIPTPLTLEEGRVDDQEATITPEAEFNAVEPSPIQEPEAELDGVEPQEQEAVIVPEAGLDTIEPSPIQEQETAIMPEAELHAVDPSPVLEQPQDSRIVGYRIPALEVPTSVPFTEDIKSIILSSYRDFRSSISKVTSLPLPERKPKAPVFMTLESTEEEADMEEDLVLSKTQCELTLEEGKVWDELTLATSLVVKPPPLPEVPATSPLGVPPPTTDLSPSVTTSLESPSTSSPFETPHTDTLPFTVPDTLETPSPAPEAKTETETEAAPDALSNTIAAPFEPPFSLPETTSTPPEMEIDIPPAGDLPTTIPTSLEPPSPTEPTSPLPEAPSPSEAVSPAFEVEIETSLAADLPTTIPASVEQLSSPLETPSPPLETLSPTPETGAETPPADDLSTIIPTPSEQPSLPPRAALPTQTPPPSLQVEEPEPEPPSFTFDHLVLSAAEDRLDSLASRSEIVADSYHRRTLVPTKATYLEAREILGAMGIPCFEVQGEHEGEGVASSLVLQGMADYVVSEDTDVLIYGAPLIRNITSHGSPLVMIHGNDVREALELSNDAYIDFAILVGTDFSQRIRNVGPMRALKLIREYETIENILNGQTKYQPAVPQEQYMAQVTSARAIFSSPPPIPDQLRLAAMSAGPELMDQAKVTVVMERCGLGRALVADSLWDYEAALDGNYFSDNPSMIVS